MTITRVFVVLAAFASGHASPSWLAAAAQPSAQRPPAAAPAAQPRRGAIPVMTLATPAWPDGARIPERHAQAGEEASPPFTWSAVPDGTASFVLVARDLDAATGAGTDLVLHWLVWNIPGASRGLPEDLPAVAELPDGTRQISVSGPYYRGPGAAASGPSHHYAFELYALDSTIDVAAVGQSPAQTLAAVLAAMAGHVRGKAAYVGLYRRPGGRE